MTIIFGLTGGIACGKSTVTKTFRSHGIGMVDADVVSREVVAPGTEGLKKVIDTFGPEYLLSDGTLDRTALGRLVFSDALALQKINSILGPMIHKEGARQIIELALNHSDIVGYDAALLFEQGGYKNFNYLILVSCPVDIQLNRLMKRNSLTREEAQARIDSQLSFDAKMKLMQEHKHDAHFVIDTSGAVENSVKQTESIIQYFRKEAGYVF